MYVRNIFKFSKKPKLMRVVLNDKIILNIMILKDNNVEKYSF